MPAGSANPPLVSIVVRSMGRPELRHALASIAQQDYPAIETIVVDATGGKHPELPEIAWPPGHTLRIVSRGERLPRPIAANVGLESMRGGWFSFLDDDDTCEASHVSTLVAAARAHPDALVVYGAGRLFDHDGRLQKAFGLRFNRALMHFEPLFYWQAALISARVRDLGCRFDAALAICEDRDFLAQIARHGDFVFVPSASTFNFRPDLGTSGTGRGPNRDGARLARYENLLRAKWAGTGTFHNELVQQRCRHAERAYFAGDLVRAKAILATVLAEYADDPNALNGLARIALAEGRAGEARDYASRALDITPHAPEFRETLAAIDAGGTPDAAANGNAGAKSRLALCPCGSGRRFKNCCGRLAPANDGVSAPADPIVERAKGELERGEAHAARERLRGAAASAHASHELLIAAGRLELDLDDPPTAFALIERAMAQHVDVESGQLLDACGAGLAQRERDLSLWAAIEDLAASPDRDDSARPDVRAAPVRLIVTSTDVRQAEQALLLRAALGGRADIASIAPGAVATSPPSTGTLVVFDPHCDWVASGTSPHRIVVRVADDDPEVLLRAFARLRDVFPNARLAYTRPAESFANRARTPMPIEYPWVDAAAFEAPPPAGRSAPMTVGRTGPAGARDDHPNDPALFRMLLGDGHRIIAPATEFLRSAFRSDAAGARPEFVVDGSAPRRPDVLLVRGRPGGPGMFDDRILDAMAAARPVVAFASALRAREWIDDGRTGFVVESEDEARQRVAELARNATLRREIGFAARAVAKSLMRAQRDRARAFYLGVSVNE
jgi:hypothetical protein